MPAGSLLGSARAPKRVSFAGVDTAPPATPPLLMDTGPNFGAGPAAPGAGPLDLLGGDLSFAQGGFQNPVFHAPSSSPGLGQVAPPSLLDDPYYYSPPPPPPPQMQQQQQQAPAQQQQQYYHSPGMLPVGQGQGLAAGSQEYYRYAEYAEQAMLLQQFEQQQQQQQQQQGGPPLQQQAMMLQQFEQQQQGVGSPLTQQQQQYMMTNGSAAPAPAYQPTAYELQQQYGQYSGMPALSPPRPPPPPPPPPPDTATARAALPGGWLGGMRGPWYHVGFV